MEAEFKSNNEYGSGEPGINNNFAHFNIHGEQDFDMVQNQKIKDGKELLYQLSESCLRQEAEDIVNEVGYDDEKIKLKFEQFAKDKPRDYDLLLYVLKRDLRSQEKEFKEKINSFCEAFPKNESYESKKEILKNKCFFTDEENSTEAIKEIREAFPGGNYLVHGTSTEGALAIIKDGVLKSVAEQRKKEKYARSRGGSNGISFSYDGVGAIPGTPRHMVAFLSSPEMCLDEKTKLVVPYLAAENELQLVSRNYDREKNSQISAQCDFFGLSSLMGQGVISDYIDLEESLKNETKDSPVEKDLDRIKSGELNMESFQNLYTYENNVLNIDPSINEMNISPGLIYADFLLRYTKEGIKLGKNLKNITAKELYALRKNTPGKQDELIFDMLDKDKELDKDETGISIKLEDQVLLVPDRDCEKWLDVLARIDHVPKAIMVYSHINGPRVPNWKLPEGHKEKAQQVIEKVLEKADIQISSVPFEQILGKDKTPEDFTGKTIKYLKWKTVSQTNEMIKNSDGKIEILLNKTE
jgi:hypothetical protein